MYFLVYVKKESSGSGFGTVVAVFIALALLVGAAEYSVSWIAMPFYLCYMLYHKDMLWVLYAALAVGCVINWIGAKKNKNMWCPLLCMGTTLFVACAIHVVAFCFQEIVWYEYFGLIITIPLLGIIFYSTVNFVIAASSIITVFINIKPFIGAVCSFFGNVFGALTLQAIVEMLVGLIDDGSFLENVRLQVSTFRELSDELDAGFTNAVESMIQYMNEIAPVWRAVCGLIITFIFMGIEHKCSNTSVF